MSGEAPRIILIDPSGATREVLARRLRAQGYEVEEAADPAVGADMALCEPPAAVVADLWMPGISGVQLSRLLRSEPATADVAIVLCGEADEPRDRFWADRAGANAYVPKRRTGALMRALKAAIGSAVRREGAFFMQLAGGTVDIRDRIARHLDAALFDSAIAAEVRALATAGALDRLFDSLVQFLAQVARYRWIALVTGGAERVALHHHPRAAGAVGAELRAALGTSDHAPWLRIEDEDAVDGPPVAPPLVRDVCFGSERVARLALSPAAPADVDASASLLTLVARELGGAIRMAALVEESQRLASTDALTGLMNRRSFAAAMAREIPRAKQQGRALAVALLDVDHFKRINDAHGHTVGDEALASLGALLAGAGRGADVAARWGGEEFVVAWLDARGGAALAAAERLRAVVEAMEVADERGARIAVTASIGVASLRPGDTLSSLIGRADRAMYRSKSAGRNRVTADTTLSDDPAAGGDARAANGGMR